MNYKGQDYSYKSICEDILNLFELYRLVYREMLNVCYDWYYGLCLYQELGCIRRKVFLWKCLFLFVCYYLFFVGIMFIMISFMQEVY